jgi:nucleotide-binding universal stress UspA family protein
MHSAKRRGSTQNTEDTMGLPKTILLPTDFSPDAEHAQRDAVRLAKKLNARLVLMHVRQLPVSTCSVEFELSEDAVRRAEASERRAFDDALESAQREIPAVEGRFVQGDPRDAILEVAHQVHADLIMMGTHGHQSAVHFLLGSVADFIMHHAPCSVLISRSSSSDDAV